MNLGPNGVGWDRRRLLAILVATVAAVVLLLMGLGYAVAHAVGAIGRDDSRTPPATGIASSQGISPRIAGGAARRDEIAAAPMLAVPANAMNPVEGTTHGASHDGASGMAEGDAPTRITVPSGTDLGPASVLTGFPHSPEGAVGQLAQIETTVLQAMSLTAAYDTYQAWALPGGVGAEEWTLTQSVQIFLDNAGMGEAKDPAATVMAEPVAGLVKGT